MEFVNQYLVKTFCASDIHMYKVYQSPVSVIFLLNPLLIIQTSELQMEHIILIPYSSLYSIKKLGFSIFDTS